MRGCFMRGLAMFSITLAVCIAAGAFAEFVVSANPSGDAEVPAQSQREQKDLPAQQRVDWDARIAWIVSAIGVGITVVGVRYVKSTLDATVGMLKEAQKTTEISQRQLIASQRPWLKVTAEISDDLKHTATGVRVQITVTVKNIGNYPASDIMFLPSIELMRGSFDPIQAYMEQQLSDAIKRPRFTFSEFLFPSDELSHNWGINLSATQVEEAKEFNSLLYMCFICCVSYASDISPARHRTAFVREIMKRPPIDRSSPLQAALLVISIEDGDIPQQALLMRKSPMAADFAD